MFTEGLDGQKHESLKVPQEGAMWRSFKDQNVQWSMTPDASVPPRKNEMTTSGIRIASVCDEIKELLLEKNAKYGDSALNPSRVFSKSSAVEQLLVRIDDKLSRIQRGAGLIANDEDVINDLIGYLVLLKIALADKPENKSTTSVKTGNGDMIIFPNSVNGYWPSDPWDGTDLDNTYDFYFKNYTIGCPD